jgi:Protein of unknown function (DUF3761)
MRHCHVSPPPIGKSFSELFVRQGQVRSEPAIAPSSLTGSIATLLLTVVISACGAQPGFWQRAAQGAGPLIKPAEESPPRMSLGGKAGRCDESFVIFCGRHYTLIVDAVCDGAGRSSNNGECPPETYKNIDGDCVERSTIPNDRGAVTAICRDGEYSYSQHRTGTCSRHGGVKEWLRKDL